MSSPWLHANRNIYFFHFERQIGLNTCEMSCTSHFNFLEAPGHRFSNIYMNVRSPLGWETAFLQAFTKSDILPFLGTFFL